MKEFGDELRDTGVAYFTASCDTPELNAKFAESLGLDYPILSDPGRVASQAYGLTGPTGNAKRWTFYIDKDGVLRHVDKKVKTTSHGKDIADKVKELGLNS